MWESKIDRDKDNVRRREKWRERLKKNQESDGVRGGGGEKWSDPSPTNLCSTQQPEAEAIKSTGSRAR